MNDYDKNDHYDNIIKNMTRLCHDKCFTTNLSEDCTTICYHKYVNTISKIERLSLELGQATESEFVTRIYKTKENILEDNYIFPAGGKRIAHLTRRFKFYSVAPLFKGYNPYKNLNELH
jgi:hypothetical protein